MESTPSPELVALLDRMTRDGLIGWRGKVGTPARRPFLRTYGREAAVVLGTLAESVSRETPTKE